MDFGFRIVYHKEVQKNDELIEFLDNKIKLMNTENSYKWGYTPSPFRRRGIGFHVVIKGKKCRFKRLSTKRRIFGVVPCVYLNEFEDHLNKCGCAKCLGEETVTMRRPYSEEDYMTYFEVGKIKG
jgi:hypothetical protein